MEKHQTVIAGYKANESIMFATTIPSCCKSLQIVWLPYYHPVVSIKHFGLKISYGISFSQEIISPVFLVWLTNGIKTFPGVKTVYQFYEVVSQTTLTPLHLAPPGPGPPSSQISIGPHNSQRWKTVSALQLLRSHSHFTCQCDMSRHNWLYCLDLPWR